MKLRVYIALAFMLSRWQWIRLSRCQVIPLRNMGTSNRKNVLSVLRGYKKGNTDIAV